MSVECYFCRKPVNPFDIGTYKLVSGWVHGKKSDAMTLREDIGQYAHEHCILKGKSGQAADQPDLFGEDDVAPIEEDEIESPRYLEFVENLKAEIDKHVPPPTIDSVGEMLGLKQKDEVEQPSGKSIRELLDNSSLGTPGAKALIATVSDEDAARVIARSKEIDREERGKE